MSELLDFANKYSQFVSLRDGDTIEAIYKGFSISQSSFDESRQVVDYQLQTEHGLKRFSSASCFLARIFNEIKPDTKIRISKKGTGNKTIYKIERETEGYWSEVGKEDEL